MKDTKGTPERKKSSCWFVSFVHFVSFVVGMRSSQPRGESRILSSSGKGRCGRCPGA
jgi:hypothetical protein